MRPPKTSAEELKRRHSYTSSERPLTGATGTPTPTETESRPPTKRKETEETIEIISEIVSEVVDWTRFQWWFTVDGSRRLCLARSRSTTEINPKLVGYVEKAAYSETEEGLIIISCNNRGVRKDASLDDAKLLIERIQPEPLFSATKAEMEGNGNLLKIFAPFLPKSARVAAPEKSSQADTSAKAPVKEKGKARAKVPASVGREKQQPPPAKKQRQTKKVESSSSDQSAEESSGVPGADMPAGIVPSEQNVMREFISKNKLISDNTMTLSIKKVNRPPVDPATGRRTLEVREPHLLHVRNLKTKMRINPMANVVPFIVMVDPESCSDKTSFVMASMNDYNYFVIGGCHSAEARRQLSVEYPDSPYYRTVQAKIYVGLTKEEVNLLAWDHNNDSEYRKGMSYIEKIRFLHNEYVDYMKSYEKAGTQFKAQCCREIGLVFDEAGQSAALRKHDNLFQLAFRAGPMWDLQESIFQMWERHEVKGQKVVKEKGDPSLLIRGKEKKMDISFRPLADDMKAVCWRSIQGIKDEKVITAVLSRVISKELSLDEMTVEFEQ